MLSEPLSFPEVVRPEIGLALDISLPLVGLNLGRSFSLSKPQFPYLYNELHQELQTQNPKGWAGDIK